METKLRIEEFPGGGYVLTNAPKGQAQCKECEQWLPEEVVAKSLMKNVCDRCKNLDLQRRNRDRYLSIKADKERNRKDREIIRLKQNIERSIEERQEALRQGRRKFNTW
jgi:hypothetical protein